VKLLASCAVKGNTTASHQTVTSVAAEASPLSSTATAAGASQTITNNYYVFKAPVSNLQIGSNNVIHCNNTDSALVNIVCCLKIIFCLQFQDIIEDTANRHKTLLSCQNFAFVSRSFYRAMLCIRGTSYGPVSVRLSLTSRSSTETAERIELVLACELPSTRPTLC